MGGRYVPAARFRTRDPRYPVDRIVIHTTQGDTLSGAVAWFQNIEARASAHYVIDTDGDIVQMVPDAMAALHAGSTTEKGWNDRSIGIEHVGWVDDGHAPTDAQLEASAMVAAKMCHDFGIPVDRAHIIGHVEVPGATHRDPGNEWPWDDYLRRVGEALASRAWEPGRAVG